MDNAGLQSGGRQRKEKRFGDTLYGIHHTIIEKNAPHFHHTPSQK